MEVFLRMFAESVSASDSYEITFTNIYEAPPKVSVKVSSTSNTFTINGDSQSFKLVDKVDGILEISRDKEITPSK